MKGLESKCSRHSACCYVIQVGFTNVTFNNNCVINDVHSLTVVNGEM